MHQSGAVAPQRGEDWLPPRYHRATAPLQVVQAGASAAVAAPLLRPGKADARPDGIYINKTKFPGKAPIITVFDHRGCKAHANKEYKGSKCEELYWSINRVQMLQVPNETAHYGMKQLKRIRKISETCQDSSWDNSILSDKAGRTQD